MNLGGIRLRALASSFSGVFLSAAGNVASSVAAKALNFFFLLVIGREFGPSGIGLVNVLQSTAATAGTVSSFGLGMYGTVQVGARRLSAPHEAERVVSEVLWLGLLLSTITASLFFLFSSQLAEYVFREQSLARPLQIVALSIVFCAMYNCASGLLHGMNLFWHLAAANAFAFGTGLAVIVVAHIAQPSMTPWLIVSLDASVSMACLFVLYRAAKNVLNLRLRITPSAIARRAREAIPFAGSSIIALAVPWACNVILTRSTGLEEVGIYGVAVQARMIVSFLPLAFASVVVSRLASLSTAIDPHLFWAGLTRFTLVSMAMAVVGGVLIWHFQNEFLELFGSRFTDVHRVMPWTIAAAIAMCLSAVAAGGLNCLGMAHANLIFNVITGAMTIGLAMSMSPRGAVGIAEAVAIGAMAHLVLTAGRLFMASRT